MGAPDLLSTQRGDSLGKGYHLDDGAKVPR